MKNIIDIVIFTLLPLQGFEKKFNTVLVKIYRISQNWPDTLEKCLKYPK